MSSATCGGGGTFGDPSSPACHPGLGKLPTEPSSASPDNVSMTFSNELYMTTTAYRVNPAVFGRQAFSARGIVERRTGGGKTCRIAKNRADLRNEEGCYSPSALAAAARTRGTRNGLVR